MIRLLTAAACAIAAIGFVVWMSAAALGEAWQHGYERGLQDGARTAEAGR